MVKFNISTDGKKEQLVEKIMKITEFFTPKSRPMTEREVERMKEDYRLKDKIDYVRSHLEQLGYIQASKDVDYKNIMQYAEWVLVGFRRKIRLTNPTTRKVTIDRFAERKFLKIWKQLIEQGLVRFIISRDWAFQESDLDKLKYGISIIKKEPETDLSGFSYYDFEPKIQSYLLEAMKEYGDLMGVLGPWGDENTYIYEQYIRTKQDINLIVGEVNKALEFILTNYIVIPRRLFEQPTTPDLERYTRYSEYSIGDLRKITENGNDISRASKDELLVLFNRDIENYYKSLISDSSDIEKVVKIGENLEKVGNEFARIKLSEKLKKIGKDLIESPESIMLSDLEDLKKISKLLSNVVKNLPRLLDIHGKIEWRNILPSLFKIETNN
jgi:hypothetical protein